mmetsp:Transcript_32993/g.94780  ORF Transcript_32993/g.94780 Transcript_32993/m.94780 type:complete len:463 (+) Transcript_32993:201-1589(+)
MYSAIPTSEHEEQETDTSGQRSARDGSNTLANAQVAAAKSMAYLIRMEAIGYCSVEKESVYGAAVAIPQVARSAGWSLTLTGLAIRCYMFLALNVTLQLFLLAVIAEEMHIMNPFSGQFHLCDFGRVVDACPGAPGCTGPGGSALSFKRMFSSFDTWSTRVYVRDALLRLFPDRAEEIDVAADPGEFGLQDYYCRLVCIFIFMLGVVDDLRGTIALFYMLINVPTLAGTWIVYEEPAWEQKERAKLVHGWSELDLVKFRVAGIPLGWKFANLAFVFFPKLYIWWTLTSGGVHFLMETAGIVDLVINCMALTFVLSIDEMIFSRLLTVASRHIMANLEDLPMFDEPEFERQADEVTLQRFMEKEYGSSKLNVLCFVVPKRFLLIVVLLVLFVTKYYYEYCDRAEDGSLVSKPMFFPTSVPYNPLSFLYGYGMSLEDSPFWKMPDAAAAGGGAETPSPSFDEGG